MKDAHEVSTAPLVALGLVGGFLTARETGIRPLGGVVLVAEGARGRLTRLVNDEKMKVQRVASGVPIQVIYVGHAEGDVPISKLSATIKALPKKVDRTTMAAVVKRVDSVSQSVTSLPIPKGIDPLRARAPRPR